MFGLSFPPRARVESPQEARAASKEFTAPARGGFDLDGLAGRRGLSATGQEPLVGSPANGSGLPYPGRTRPLGPAGGAPTARTAPARSVERSPRPSPAPRPGARRDGTASGRALDRGEVEFAPQELGQRRKDRWRLRELSAGLLPGEAVARCGRYAAHHPGQIIAAPSGFIPIKKGKHGAFFANVVTCKSVWHCPCCAAKVAAGRREEVHAAIERHLASGGMVYMATATAPHHEFQRYAHLKDGVADAWRCVAQGKEWKPAKEAAGLAGSVRALETTHGGNGWHPHLHVLLFFDHQNERRAEAFGRVLFKRWARAIERKKFGTCSPDAWRFERCRTPQEAGDYAAKWGPDWELTHAHLKDAKGGGRTPWRILMDLADNPRASNEDRRRAARDEELFREYAHASKGARQLTWSRGLKERLGLDDKSDADLADDEGPAETVALVHEHALQTLMIQRRATALLDAAESGGGEAVIAFLYRLGIPQEYYRDVQRPEARPPPTAHRDTFAGNPIPEPQDMAG